MAAYRRFYDSRHLQADCQEPGSAPETYTRQSSMGYLTLIRRSPIDNHRYTQIVSRKSLKWTTGKSQPSPYHTDWLSCGFTSHSSVFYETDRQTDASSLSLIYATLASVISHPFITAINTVFSTVCVCASVCLSTQKLRPILTNSSFVPDGPHDALC